MKKTIKSFALILVASLSLTSCDTFGLDSTFTLEALSNGATIDSLGITLTSVGDQVSVTASSLFRLLVEFASFGEITIV